MKKTILTVLLFQVMCLTASAASSDLIAQWKTDISKSALKEAYNTPEDSKKKPLDQALNLYATTVGDMIDHYEKNKSQVSTSEERDFLVYLIHQTQYFSDEFDGGNLHHYMLSKLYRVIPKDLSVAIERSNLTAKQKSLLRKSLKNQIKIEKSQ